MASLLVLIRAPPASGPLYLLFPRPGKVFPRHLPGSLPHLLRSLLKQGLLGKTFLDPPSEVAPGPCPLLSPKRLLPDFFYSTYLHLAWARSEFVVCLLLLMSAPSGRPLFCSLLFTQRLEQCSAQNLVFNKKRTVASGESVLLGHQAPGPGSNLPSAPTPMGAVQPLSRAASPQCLPLSFLFFFFPLAITMTCRISQTREQIHATGVTQHRILNPLSHQGTPALAPTYSSPLPQGQCTCCSLHHPLQP